ncbi:hypothetical protein LCGC14_2560960 [marine sediment metagenome]|uniref:Transglycosylase SLT domain-containing protein n=1 Tax=marine sediment metagenome TaxID=412755 RepID=A0A0F9DD62_9ZZZZ
MNRLLILAFLALSACAPMTVTKAPEAEPAVQPDYTPAMRWDFRPESKLWTNATIDALNTTGAMLPAMVPSDYKAWCPAYATKSTDDRAAFWAGLLSALAKHESTWNPRAVGGGGLWYGLVQIDPRTARGYDCRAKTGEALKDGVANLQCAVKIAAKQVVKRGSVARGMLDWGPFHSASKRAEMQQWTRQQPYCQEV